jgi:cyclase
VSASGGAGNPEHLVEVFRRGAADAALIASMVHFGTWSLGSIKRHLAEAGIPVRPAG